MVSRQIQAKIDGIAFHSGAHTQQGSRKLILNLTGSESPPAIVSHKFYLLMILKYKNKDIIQ